MILIRHLFLTGLFLYPFFSAGAALGEESVDLAALKWEKRILLIPCSDHTKSGQELKRILLKNQKSLNERDILFFILGEKQISNSTKKLIIPDRQMQKRFPLSGSQYTVYLIGKDGGTKLVKNDRLDLEKIFSLIDQMPMRQQEMLERKITSTPQKSYQNDQP